MNPEGMEPGEFQRFWKVPEDSWNFLSLQLEQLHTNPAGIEGKREEKWEFCQFQRGGIELQTLHQRTGKKKRRKNPRKDGKSQGMTPNSTWA